MTDMENTLAAFIAKVAASGNPVIHVSESFHTNPWSEEDAPEYEEAEYWIDPAKITDDFSARYVMHILEYALDGRTSAASSRKWSFGDTPDWWDDIRIDPATIGDRKVLHIDVATNH